MADRAAVLMELAKRGALPEKFQGEYNQMVQSGQIPQFSGSVTNESRGAAQAKIAAARSLRGQLERVEQMYRQGIGKERSVTEYLPTPENKKFDAAVSGMMPLARQAFRVPGSGADTEREGKYIEEILPNRFSFDEANDQRFAQLRQMLDDIERDYGPIAGATGAPQSAAPPQQSHPGQTRLRYNPETGDFDE